MDVRYNVTGEHRKELVTAISEIIGWEPVYKGAPTFAYAVGDFHVSREGTLSFSDRTESEEVERLLEGLEKRGFNFEEPGNHDNLTIEMPLEGFTEAALENLNRLISSKEALIKKSIGTDNLPVERLETTLRFPWFRIGIETEEVNAYSLFISALCKAAKEQHRVSAKKKPADNEKFAFRVFLIRLGFVGDEYKGARKILLRKLTGNSAFKNGNPKAEVSFHE